MKCGDEDVFGAQGEIIVHVKSVKVLPGLANTEKMLLRDSLEAKWS